MTNKSTKKPPKPNAPAKAQRLAEALRQNLLRRKAKGAKKSAPE